ncbi:EAL domain-containing protein [Methylobacterium sp. Leaf113]|uniref:EAL domain-containing protein n=1 Tax=Methylobacterium sp. Leaf113 TaxID=1736259 RepID=UPI0012E850DC|nr:EAL domain-containing protein [Methylobacterium sp. Leaf113]
MRPTVFRRTTGLTNRYDLEARAGHLDEVLQFAPYLALTHTVIAGAVLVLFWSEAHRIYLTTLFFSVVLTVTLATIAAWRYRPQRLKVADIVAGHRIAVLFALILGLSWGSMPLALFPAPGTTDRVFMVALCAGLMATTYTFGSLPHLGLVYCVPLALGSLGALILDGAASSWWLAMLMGIYSVFVAFTAGRMGRLSEQRIIDRVRVSEQNETISLLLHDFEANTSDWLWETDAEDRLQHVSDRIGEVAGEPPQLLRETPLEALFLGVRDPRPMTQEIADVLTLVAERKAFRERVVEVTIGGLTRWWRISGRPILDDGDTFLGFRGVGSDVTDTHQSEARIAYLASYDPLTGLANRTLFQDMAAQLCARARTTGEACALLYVDLDGFKFVNDTFGHVLGDTLLAQVAQRLIGTVPPGAQVSRLGGDEFAILLAGVDEDALITLAKRIIGALSMPYTLNGVQVEIGASVGLAQAPRDAHNPEGLLSKADLALYRAKVTGWGNVCVFSTDLEASMRRRHEIEVDLKRAVAQGEFTLHYQPLVSLDDGRIHTFEALLRWTRSSGESVSPADFLPIAEASGLISQIGRWVLMQACREAAHWPEDIRLAVNLSPIQFRNGDLIAEVRQALEASGLPPKRLEIEVTESVFFEMNATTIANLNALRALDIRVALDDFGTGYSSLSYLIRFPVDKIKIDRSFIKDMDSRPECLAIIEAILALARKLSITVTAEGVETAEQAQMLKASGCDDIQGFLFSPARPAAEIPHLITALPMRFCEVFPRLPVPFQRAVA